MMNSNFISFWGCLICSTIWQANGSFKFSIIWIVMSAIYGIFAVIGAKKK